MQVKPGEIATKNQDSPQTTGPTSGDGVKSTSPTAKTYTESEHLKAISDVKADFGRERVNLVKDRDAAVSELAAVKGAITTKEEQIKTLNERIDTLAANDPDKKKLVEISRNLEKSLSGLNADRDALEADKKAHAERLTKAETAERAGLCAEIAGAYDDGNAAKLKAVAERSKLTTREQLDDYAVNVFGWTKKAAAGGAPVGDAPATFNADSGVTNGGSESLASLSPADRIKRRDQLIREGKK